MRIVFLPSRKEIELRGSYRVGDLLRELKLLPGTVLVIRNDEMLTTEDEVHDSDTVEIRNVISGGTADRIEKSA
ncbi:MAG: MoaD/ThiS family protein [Candidatus Binatia bacterium]|nr:MoaD/ThiS family protein [Candidatus Binatia bacterium]